MPKPIYDSRDSACKHPFGSLATGQPATFTIHLPKKYQGCIPELKLFEMDKWDVPVMVPMELCGSDMLTNSYCCTFQSEQPGLYVYCFEFSTEDSVLTVRRGWNGAGYVCDDGGLWQLTVYDKEMTCPSFLREGVIYQIFPDRFCNSGEQRGNVPEDRTLRSDWGALPYWRPNEFGEVTNSDYFGGDLKGITGKLDYLESLGVTTLYLNPIFEAHSNHRYNVADYRQVDPLLGTCEDFRQLCEKAKARGISILLDGVFSHTGSDSVYFNKQKRYGNGGAYNDPASPFCSWYQFTEYPYRYECWWGFDTLPNLNETEPAFLDYICGKNGVLHHWLNLGAAGFRLDVADELPDAFLDQLYASVKSHSKDNAIIGEVWEDASHKISYGKRRRYLLGGQLDSVMNYPFKDAVLNFIRYGNGEDLYYTIMQILENYPKPSIQALMNFLSTHDIIRAITALGGPPIDYHDRDWQEAHQQLSPEEYSHGCRLFSLASILQFGLPGIPCVYYGDEAGMCGYKDPFNRGCFPWGSENQELQEHITKLGKMRRDYPVFADADFTPLYFSHDIGGFIRSNGPRSFLFLVNRSNRHHAVELPHQFAHAKILVQVGGFSFKELGAFSGVVLLLDEAER